MQRQRAIHTLRRRCDVDPRRLMLEVTESSLLFDLEACVAKLAELRAVGIGIALDDFGTGYSSLSHLQDLPLDVLKIDKSFVYRVDGNSQSPLVSGIIAIGNLMGMKVVAEGVETPEQRDHLLQMSCRHYQGYLFSKPLNETAFIKWVAAREKSKRKPACCFHAETRSHLAQAYASFNSNACRQPQKTRAHFQFTLNFFDLAPIMLVQSTTCGPKI